MQQAKLALATIQDTSPQAPRPRSGVPYTLGAPIIRSTGLSLKISKEGLVGTSSYSVRHNRSAEEVGEAVNEFGIKWLAGESVTDQVRRQKEKFWLSLAEQGFVKPPEALLLNKELNIKGHDNSGTGAELHQETQKSLTSQSQSSSKSGSSSDISHPVPSTSSRTQHSPSDKHSQSGASSDNRTKQSLTTKRQFNQSMSVNNNGSSSTVSGSESQSFPSYEGISSPE